MQPHSPRVLLVGLDAAEPGLLRAWAEAGHLPTLRRLFDGGRVLDLASPARHFPDVVWPVLYTGRSPGHIAPYFFIRPHPRTARLEMVEHELSGAEPFWLVAARHGRRCAVIDAPKVGSHPPPNGLQLVNWGAHATTATPVSFPTELLARLRATYGPYPLHTCDDHGPSLDEYERLRRALLDAVALRRRVLLDLLRQGPWDLFFAVFAETHCAGHQFWHLHDPDHPRHPAGAGALRHALRDVYRAVDEAVGALIAAAGPQTRVVICSAHGMQPEYHGRDLLPTLLAWWGMGGPANVPPDPSRERTSPLRRPLLTRLRHAVPLRWQYAVKRRLPRAVERELVCRFVGAPRFDVRARACCVPNNDLNPAIRLNLAGRDPYGRVAAADAAALRAFLLDRLRELVNPATGRAALREVSLSADHYEGPWAAELPDIVGLWDTTRPLEALYSPGYGTVIGAHRDLRSGGHGVRGLLALGGAPAATDDGDVRDVAPTVLQLLGVPIPADMQGIARGG